MSGTSILCREGINLFRAREEIWRDRGLVRVGVYQNADEKRRTSEVVSILLQAVFV